MTTTLGVLFVCHANICRSPLAEAVFRHLVSQRGLQARFHIDSAGTWAPDGARPHEHSVAVAERHGIPPHFLGLGSRAVCPEDMDRFDHVLAMDRRNFADLERLRRMSAFADAPGRWPRVRLLRTVLTPHAEGPESDVPDPVRGGPAEFLEAYTLIEASCRRLLDELHSP
jgi:protein-tyrosine phosphatase